jgi:hypothetical protein
MIYCRAMSSSAADCNAVPMNSDHMACDVISLPRAS